MKGQLKKLTGFNLFFSVIIVIFIIALAITVSQRGGRDLKVGLFGVEQVLQKKSPYENPSDANRTIFRYAPGITILEYPFRLTSKMVAPFKFKDMLPSIYMWYIFELLVLFFCARLLLKIMPGATKEKQLFNLKLSVLMSLPFIGYELSNSQNKIFALFFVILAVFLFDKKRMLLSSISFCIALTIYIPLIFFLLLFAIKTRGRYVLSFIIGAVIVFVIVPSLFWGFEFNKFLLKEWFNLSIKPFSFTDTYASYIDLRRSSQSLPSVVGRLFVSGKTGSFNYALPAQAIHYIVRFFSAAIILLSCLAVWRRSKEILKGFEYSIFLLLGLLLPMYGIYYTWAWMFVPYFAMFNLISYSGVSAKTKRTLIIIAIVSYAFTCTIGFDPLSERSAIFWATVLLWFTMVVFLVRQHKMLGKISEERL